MKQTSSARGDKKRSGKGAALKLGAVALLLLLGAGCGHHAAPETTASGPLEVETVHPKTGTLTREIEQPGHLMAYETTPIYARIPGELLSVNVDIGDHVKEGDVLAELYVPEMKSKVDIKAARILQAKADVEQAKENLEAAEANITTWKARLREAIAGVNRATADYKRWSSEYDRDKVLLDKGVFDKQTLDEALHQLKVSEAAWEEARAKKSAADASLAESKAKRNKAKADVDVAAAMVKVETAEHQEAVHWYNYATVKAPYEGIVTARNVHTGAFVQPANSGSTSKAADPLFTVMRTDIMRVTVEVPETDAVLVKEGMRFKLTDASFASLRADRVPAPVVDKLKALKDKVFALESRFRIKLLRVLSTEDLKRWYPKILICAKEGTEGDQAVVRLQALSGREVMGTVTRFSYSFDDRARTLRVEVHVKNPKGELRPGMYANIKIVAKRPSTLMLPTEAVLNDILANGDRSYCFIAENGKVKKTFLQVGVRGNEGVEVMRKMTAGQDKWEDFTGREAIVISNPSTLLDGQVVEAKPAQAKSEVKSARAE